MSCTRRKWTRRAAGLVVVCLTLTIALAAPARSGFAADVATRELVDALLKVGGQEKGVCAILGCDEEVPIEFARASELLIHVRDPDEPAIAQLRSAADSAGFDIRRLAAEVGGLDQLPYTDNMIDVLVITRASEQRLDELSSNEVLRVLRPKGIAIVGKAVRSRGADIAPERLQTWLSKSSALDLSNELLSGLGTWVVLQKPEVEGTGEWTHWTNTPDNNPVSDDRVIKAPYLTQFMAGPLYIGMPSITTAAGGRTFLAIGHISHHEREWETLHRLIARNGYNGTVLWERKLPDGYMVHRSAFIATPDQFFMIDGHRSLILDPATGDEIGEVRIPEIDGAWKWMVKVGDTLYALLGPDEPGVETIKGDRTFGGWSWADLSPEYYGQKLPLGYGDTVVAYDLKNKEVRWHYKDESPIDSRAMAFQGGKLYLFCPEKHVRCLAADDGKVIWTNEAPDVRDLIAQPGKNLTSTPGFRTECLTVATPDALIIQGQTRMNVVALSTDDGYLLWTKRKVTNNPNAIFVDDKVILGVGEGGNHVVIDPVSGDVEQDLKFRKAACTRLTASADSFFCRGEGTLRFDRDTKRVLIDGAQRPACNDGAIPAHGLLYLGPWQCDCNLSLIGHIAKCSAGDFRFDDDAADARRLQVKREYEASDTSVVVDDNDWSTYRGNSRRSASSPVRLQAWAQPVWAWRPSRPFVPTASTTAGGLIFFGGNDGMVRAVNAANGQLRWQFATSGPIKFPPTIWEGRALFGSGDGFAYAVDASTGELLWRFQAAPVERLIMFYGTLGSTWPVHTGVTVHDGIAYFAAGIIDQDGTYVYALDAATGKLKWQNDTCGHLNPELRKGISAQGIMTVLGDQLMMAGGNQVSPAIFDLQTGECCARQFRQGQPKANNGQFVGVFNDAWVIVGGRTLHSSPRNVSNKNSFVAISQKAVFNLSFGGIPPAWNDEALALVNFKNGKLSCFDASQLVEGFEKGLPNEGDQRRTWLSNIAEKLATEGTVRWSTDLGKPNKFEVVSLAVCPNAVVAVVKTQERFRARAQWYLTALRPDNAGLMLNQELIGEPAPGGISIDRDGRVVVSMLDGQVIAFAKK